MVKIKDVNNSDLKDTDLASLKPDMTGIAILQFDLNITIFCQDDQSLYKYCLLPLQRLTPYTLETQTVLLPLTK